MEVQSPAAYIREPYRTAIETIVTAVGHDARGPWVELADTILYPEGGGQPSDRGAIDGALVVDVGKAAGAVRHHLAAGTVPPDAHGVVRVELDWARRFDHMQQHTAQHVLTAVAADRFGWATTAFHLGADTADIELETASISQAQRVALEDAVAAELRAAHPVTSAFVELGDLARRPIRTRGLPAGHDGPVRLITIGTLDASACGGTHVGNTAEVEALALLATERMRGGLRLSWVAGGRVRRRLADHEARAAVLRAKLGAADAAVGDALDARLARLADAQRRIAELESAMALRIAEHLVATMPAAARDRTASVRSPTLVAAHLADATASEAAAVARAVTRLRSDVIAVVSAGRSPDGSVVVSADPSLDEGRVGALAAAVFVALGGRGGGRGGLHQGTATTPERVAPPAAWLEEVARGMWPPGG